jgi:hypothetical protein
MLPLERGCSRSCSSRSRCWAIQQLPKSWLRALVRGDSMVSIRWGCRSRSPGLHADVPSRSPCDPWKTVQSSLNTPQHSIALRGKNDILINNHARLQRGVTIVQAVNHVLAIHYPCTVRLIVVDDGSTDETVPTAGPVHRPGRRGVRGGGRCTGWRFVVEELTAIVARPHLADPAETAALRGPKKRQDRPRRCPVAAHAAVGGRVAGVGDPAGAFAGGGRRCSSGVAAMGSRVSTGWSTSLGPPASRRCTCPRTGHCETGKTRRLLVVILRLTATPHSAQLRGQNTHR